MYVDAIYAKVIVTASYNPCIHAHAVVLPSVFCQIKPKNRLITVMGIMARGELRPCNSPNSEEAIIETNEDQPNTNGESIGVAEIQSTSSINVAKVGTLVALFSILAVLVGLLIKPAISRRRMHCLFCIPSLNFDARHTS